MRWAGYAAVWAKRIKNRSVHPEIRNQRKHDWRIQEEAPQIMLGIRASDATCRIGLDMHTSFVIQSCIFISSDWRDTALCMVMIDVGSRQIYTTTGGENFPRKIPQHVCSRGQTRNFFNAWMASSGRINHGMNGAGLTTLQNA